MIEVVAIDNRGAEAEILRLAADFAESRLLLPKQKKRLRCVVEVTGTAAPAPIAREQLAKTPGLLKSAHYHFQATISLLYGFDSAALQLMHELVHMSQIINKRYQITAKTVKIEGTKQPIYQARWLGKKVGVIDDIAWDERPWEQEAATIGEQLASEFRAFLYGTQNSFGAQGHEKGAKNSLRLYEVALALPITPPAPAMMPEPNLTEPILPDPILAETPIFDPLTGATIPEFGAAPSAESQAPSPAQEDELLADIDALLSADTNGGDHDGAFDDAPLDSDSLTDASGGEKQTYVLGIATPRTLKLSVLKAKKQELAKRGLLQD